MVRTQSLPDRVLWMLNNTDGQSMKRRVLRRHLGARIQELNDILDDLERKGKIRIDSSDVVSLI